MKDRIVATDTTIKKIVKEEIRKLGPDADLNHIDVSHVTVMNGLFSDSFFNGDISKWDVSNVKHADGIYYHSAIADGNKPDFKR